MIKQAIAILAIVSASASAETISVHSNGTALIYTDCSLAYYSLTPGIRDASYLYASCEAPDPFPSASPVAPESAALDEIAIAYQGGFFISNGCRVLRSVAASQSSGGVIEVECGNPLQSARNQLTER